MDVPSTRHWTAEELHDLQRRGRVFYEMFPGAKASDELRQQGDPNRSTENAIRARRTPTTAQTKESLLQ